VRATVDTVDMPPVPRPLRCRLGFHSWQTVRTTDGTPILECQRCGELDLPSKTIRLRDYRWPTDDKNDRRP
jgi:hypothetical protein